jgi:hypothetical protein
MRARSIHVLTGATVLASQPVCAERRSRFPSAALPTLANADPLPEYQDEAIRVAGVGSVVDCANYLAVLGTDAEPEMQIIIEAASAND